MKKLVLTFLLVFSFMFICNQEIAYAEENKTLNLNGTELKGNFTEEDKDDLYEFTLDKSGYVEINLTSYVNGSRWWLLDENLEELDWTYGVGVDETIGFSKEKIGHHLAPGKYYFKLTGSDRWGGFLEGKYEVKAKFTDAEETYQEANDDVAHASVVKLNTKINGQIATNDFQDVYAFEVPKSGEIALNMKSYMDFYAVRLYDNNGEELWCTAGNEISATGYVEKTHDLELVAGTYYIKVTAERFDFTNETHGLGNYTFSLNYTDAGETYEETSEKLKNEYEDAPEISLGTAIKGHIAMNDSYDIYKVTTKKRSRLVLDVTSYKPSCLVEVYTLDGERKIEESFDWDKSLAKKDASYYADLDAGSYYIKISGDEGNYDLKVSSLNLLSECDIKVDESVVCTGLEVKVPMTITYEGYTLKEGVDFTTEYKDNVDFGTASVKILGIGNFAGEETKEFDIVLEIGAIAVSGEDYKFKFLSETEVALAGLQNTKISDINVVSNVRIGGKWFNITEIDEKAFYNNKTIKTLKSTNNVEKIGANAFYGCSNLKKIEVLRVITLENNAFEKCTNLKEVNGVGKDSVVSIGKNRYKVLENGTFEFTKLENKDDTSLSIPATAKIGAKSYKVTSVASKAAYNNKKIKKVTIGKNVKNIGSKAFQKCTALTDVTLNCKNITVGSVFDGCKNIKTIKGGKGCVLTIGNYKYKITDDKSVAVAGLKSKSTKKVEIGSTVKLGKKSYKITSVASKAFAKTKVTSAKIGNNVKTIGAQAFESCTSLKTVTIGTGVTKIDKKAFSGCKKLATVTINTKKLKTVGSSAFKNTKSSMKVTVPKAKYSSYVSKLKKAGVSTKAKITKK